MGESKKNILLMHCSGKQEHKTIKMIQQITSLYLQLKMTDEIHTFNVRILLLVIAWIITKYQYNNYPFNNSEWFTLNLPSHKVQCLEFLMIEDTEILLCVYDISNMICRKHVKRHAQTLNVALRNWLITGITNCFNWFFL